MRKRTGHPRGTAWKAALQRSALGGSPALTPNPYVPVLDNPITCAFDDALSLIVTVPDFAPFVFGENVTLIMHFAPPATLAPHVEVMPNCPEAFIEETVKAVLPVFVSVTVCGSLVVPAVCFLKFSGVVGEKLTTPVLSSRLTLPRDPFCHRG